MPRHAELRPRKLTSGLWRVDVAPSLSPTRKRLKKDFENEASAKTYITSLKAHHAHPVSLTGDQTREAHAAYQRLPDGLKLGEAVDRGITSWRRERTGRTFAAVLEQVLAAKAAKGVGDRHQRDMRQKAGRFAEEFGDRPIGSIESAEVRRWLTDLRSMKRDNEGRMYLSIDPVSAESRNCYRRVLGTVFSFAVKEEYIPRNPIVAVETNKTVVRSTPIFTPAEAHRLLSSADKHRFDESGQPSDRSFILPAVAIGFFAGLRPEETYPLDWSKIDFEHRQIDVTEGKTAARPRYVPINDTLLAWLQPYREATGRVCPVSLWRTLKKVRKKAGLTWAKDVMRHSFASHTLPINPDVHALAAVMGNSVEVIHKHYRRPVRLEQAREYFAILPKP